ncbi:hypothetical protein SOV_17280 [Sporomusa ovata DSM 2662]|uniref:Uncharacterized protein n=1 Tax=Sporomusa ovata TaxID=2378 RepID=A0A0U1KW54_9FIRM|nr:hypothetical protein [Sporomusa ovata]EQB29328.1 hypothetical protein SOV_1c10610 [Sporomusa ovata DSM 2662]CQR71369.1 hypothetical protein SpAn4DRAFT_3874 [Sporomusa ovata]
MAAVLVEFICPLCSGPGIWAYPSAIIRCPYCTRWLTVKDVHNPAKLDPESEQLILF